MSTKGVWASPNCIWGMGQEQIPDRHEKKREHGSTFATTWIREA
jgi:hypothetical protein